VTEEQLLQLIAYVRSLSPEAQAPAAGAAAGGDQQPGATPSPSGGGRGGN
jgi:hypothetical protein